MDWFDDISNCHVQSDNDIEKLVEYFEICDVKDVTAVTQALQTFASMCKSINEGTTYRSFEGLRVILKLLERSSCYRIKQWCFVALNAAIENNANHRGHLSSPTTFATIRVVLNHSNLIPSFQLHYFLQNSILFFVNLVLNEKSGQDLARKSGCLRELKRLYQETFPIFRNNVTNFPSNWGSKSSLDTWQFINNALITSMSDPDNDENQNICASLQTFCFHMIESSNDWLIIKQIATFLNSVFSNNEEIKFALRSIGVFHVFARSLTRVMKEFDAIEDKQSCEDALLSLLNLYISMIKDHPTNAFHGLKFGVVEKLLQLLANPNICVEAKTLAVYILIHSVNISKDCFQFLSTYKNLKNVFANLWKVGNPKLVSSTIFLFKLVNKLHTRNLTQTTEVENIMVTNRPPVVAENWERNPTIKSAIQARHSDSSDDISNLFANKSTTQNPRKRWYLGDSIGANTKTMPKIVQVSSNTFNESELSPVDHLKFLKIDGKDSTKTVDQTQNASSFHTANDSNDSTSSLMDNPFRMNKRFCPIVVRSTSQASSEGFVPITSSKLDINSFVNNNRNETLGDLHFNGEKRLDLQHENLFLQNTDKIDSIRTFNQTSSFPIITPLKLVLPEKNSEKIQKKTHSPKNLPSVQPNPLLLSEPKVVSLEQRNVNVASVSTTSACSPGQSSPRNDVPQEPQTILESAKELNIVTQEPPQNSLLKPSYVQSLPRNGIPLEPPQTILESTKELNIVTQVPPKNSLLKPSYVQSLPRNEVPLEHPETILESAKELNIVPQVPPPNSLLNPSYVQLLPRNEVPLEPPETILESTKELNIVTKVPPQNSLLKPSYVQSLTRNEVILEPTQTILESAKESDKVTQVLKPESNAQKPTKRVANAGQTLSTRSEYKISQAQPLVKSKNMRNKTTTTISSLDNSSTINVFKNKASKIINKRCSLKTGLTSISNANHSSKPILLSQFETPAKDNLENDINLAFADSSSNSSDTRNILKPVPLGHDKLKPKRYKKRNDELKKKNLTEFERLDNSSESIASNILKNQSNSDIGTVNKPERKIICVGCNTPEELGLERVDCRNYKAMLEIYACPYHKLKLELEERFLAWYHGAREEYFNSQTFH